MERYLDSNYKLKNMTKEVAFKAIDFLMKNSSDSNVVYVSFYGGEPFLQIDLIKSCVEYCKEKYPFKIPSYNLTTNGLLFENDDIVDFVIKNKFHMLVSLNDTKRSHDEHLKKILNEKLQFHIKDQIDDTEFEFIKEYILNSTKIYHNGFNKAANPTFLYFFEI